jgi:hypothetical protein
MPRSGPDANWRDALCHVAQALAGFAVINRDGELEIRSFGTEPVAAVPKGRCYSLAPADYVSRHTSLSCESGTDVIVVAGEPNDGLNLAVRGNPFFDVGELADHYQTVADMYGAVKGLSYVPGQWSYAGDPALDAGDMVTIDGRDVLLTGIVFRYHAPQDLRSVGANPRYGSVVPASERRQHEAKVLTLEEIRRVQGELVDVNAQIVRTQDNIQIWVQDTYTASADYFSKVTELQSLIEQNAESISLSVGGLTTVISDLDDALTSRIDGMNTSFLIDSAGAHIRKSVDGDLGRYEVFIDDASFRIRSITPDAPPADPSEDAAAVAWIDNDDMHIHNATVVNALDLGSFRFEPRVSGNLSLVWKG